MAITVTAIRNTKGREEFTLTAVDDSAPSISASCIFYEDGGEKYDEVAARLKKDLTEKIDNSAADDALALKISSAVQAAINAK